MPPETRSCEHAAGIQSVVPRARGCEECMALGVGWRELRVCLSCGHVGCCEDSPHAHALQHFRTSAHPLIASYERGEIWAWCYVHRRYLDLPAQALPRRRSVLADLARLFRRRAVD